MCICTHTEVVYVHIHTTHGGNVELKTNTHTYTRLWMCILVTYTPGFRTPVGNEERAGLKGPAFIGWCWLDVGL